MNKDFVTLFLILLVSFYILFNIFKPQIDMERRRKELRLRYYL